MKKYLYMILAVVASLLFFSCETEQPTGEKYAAAPEVEIISKDDVFAAEGGNGKIEVKADGPVSAKVTGSWLAASVSGDVINLSAEANGSIESRYAILDITSGNAASSLTITQFGLTSDKIWEESYDFAYSGGSVSLNYSGSGVVHISIIEGKEWIDTDVADGKFIISAKPNAYKAPREGKVSFAVGKKDAVEVGVKQAGNPAGLNPGDPEPKDFTVVDAWTPKYYGLSDTDDTKAIVGVEAAEGSSAGRYFIKVVPAAEYNAVGDQYLFLNAKVHGWLAENPTICKDSEKIEIDALTVGNYFIYAIGVNNQGAINYKYAVAPVAVTKVLSPYEKFLGTWRITRGSYEDTWTITEKVLDQSYSITGFESLDADAVITATFNAADNTMVIAAQSNVGTYTFTNSGEQTTVTLSLMGVVEMSGRLVPVGGSYTICSAAITGDGEMTLSAADPIKLSDGNTYDIVGVEFFGKEDPNSSSGWTFNHSTPSRFPFVATQLSQGEGSGGGGGGGDTTGYNAWLGTWNAGGGRTLVFAQKTAGTDYTVTDSGFYGFEYVAEYDSKTGGILLHTHLVGIDGIDEYYFGGIDGDSLRFGSEDSGYLIAKGVIGNGGSSATISAVPFEGNDGGTVQATALTILDYQTEDSADYDKGWYGLSVIEDFAIPASLSKASGSSTSVRRANSISISTGVIESYSAAKSHKWVKTARIR
jgi:hypothetical protein